jgi:hypothetical protein
MRRAWTAEDDAVLRARYPHERTSTVASALNRTLSSVYVRAQACGLGKSAEYLSTPSACRTNGRQGISTRFPKGHVPANMGLRRPGWAPGRMKDTQFQKGVRQGVAVRLYQPIGTERISKDGYLERKINDDLPLQGRWRAVHLVVWEAAHGPLPKGHAVCFTNGDKRDIRLENLECITRSELMRRNTVHNYPKPIAQAIQLLGALNRQIRERTRDAREEQDGRLTESPIRDARSAEG